MKLVTDQPGQAPVIWQWMNKRTRLPWSSDLRCIATMRKDGSIAAAVGYNAWTFSACWMHVAFENTHALTRELWRAAFEYPFVTCGVEAVYCLIYQTNDEALRLVRKLGYREIAKTVDCFMFEMKADECRWLKGVKDGRQRISTSCA